ncbi:pyridoxal phosphate-dependent transferase [Cytidiella melzeri]|nr:pyridoxal phosphate-dependent transferase [Cytidiella melzeri]
MNVSKLTDNDLIGIPIPHSQHAISVSFPTWAVSIGYKERDLAVLDRLKSGYPRYWIHHSVRTLSYYLEQKYAKPNERLLLFRSAYAAKECVEFMARRNAPSRVLDKHCLQGRPGSQLYIVLFDLSLWSVAKQFWQHTGFGCTSRLAIYHLNLLGIKEGPEPTVHRVDWNIPTDDLALAGSPEDRSPPLPANEAKLTIRHRIALLLDIDVGDVYLTPGGMNAIWSAHHLCMGAISDKRKSICFGFPYVDTLKVIEKWGPGAFFYPDGGDHFIDELEKQLAEMQAADPSQPPILALYTEIPSNPLLRSVNLHRLRQLADKYDFLIVVDDTLGNFANLQIMHLVDIIVTSLSKLFGGLANVMGGNLSLNPAGRHYSKLQAWLKQNYEDVYFDEDAIVMEYNSRDFVKRSNVINGNAEAVCDYLKTISSIVDEVYYPKWQTPENYKACLRKTLPMSADAVPEPGYGGLFSVLFKSIAAAQGFYDALSCAKGPSLGTNFTLACPYAIIAHYYELDWAKDHGVPLQFVRVSVGLESRAELMEMFTTAVKAGEKAHTEFAPGSVPEAVWKRGIPDPPTLVAYARSSAGWE